MNYTIVFITYKSYSCFYECNNRNITSEIFRKYATIKEDMATVESKPYTHMSELPSIFPDLLNRTYYHPSIIDNVLLLLNARSQKRYNPYFIRLVYKNELWCFEKDGYYKPLFFHKVDEKNRYNDIIKSFLQQQFPITNNDVYKHPYKDLKYQKLPNSFYFTKGIYIKRRFFDYIIDLIETPSIIFKNKIDTYEDDEHAFVEETNVVPYECTEENEIQEDDITTEESKPYITQKIDRSITSITNEEQDHTISIL